MWCSMADACPSGIWDGTYRASYQQQKLLKQGTHKLPEVLQRDWRRKNTYPTTLSHLGPTHGDIFWIFTRHYGIHLIVQTKKQLLPTGIHFWSGHPGSGANIALHQNAFMDQGSKELVGAFHHIVTHLEEIIPGVHLQFAARVQNSYPLFGSVQFSWESVQTGSVQFC